MSEMIYRLLSKSHSYLSVKVVSCHVFLMFSLRALSVDERNKAIKQTWKQLDETAVMVQQRHGRAAAS